MMTWSKAFPAAAALAIVLASAPPAAAGPGFGPGARALATSHENRDSTKCRWPPFSEGK